MLPLDEVFEAPLAFEFARNGKRLVANRVELTQQPVLARRATIGDAEGVQFFSPIGLRSQRYRCFLYRWQHPSEPINVCLLLAPTDPKPNKVIELRVRQSFAPQVPGIPVDSGAISVLIGNEVFTVASGFGDGSYPVFAIKPWLRAASALLVDFKVWETNRNLVLSDEQRFDEFGVVVTDYRH